MRERGRDREGEREWQRGRQTRNAGGIAKSGGMDQGGLWSQIEAEAGGHRGPAEHPLSRPAGLRIFRTAGQAWVKRQSSERRSRPRTPKQYAASDTGFGLRQVSGRTKGWQGLRVEKGRRGFKTSGGPTGTKRSSQAQARRARPGSAPPVLQPKAPSHG